MSLWLIIIISCLAMVAKDAVATFLTVAEARGRAGLSGALNALGTPASVIFYSYGTNDMVHGHGWVGWLGLLPIMLVDLVDGIVFTAQARKIHPDARPVGTFTHLPKCQGIVRRSPDQEAHG